MFAGSLVDVENNARGKRETVATFRPYFRMENDEGRDVEFVYARTRLSARTPHLFRQGVASSARVGALNEPQRQSRSQTLAR
jgi:hypothetical protein